LNIYY